MLGSRRPWLRASSDTSFHPMKVGASFVTTRTANRRFVLLAHGREVVLSCRCRSVTTVRAANRTMEQHGEQETSANESDERKVFVLGLDFDSTITESDTCEYIVKAAMQDNREGFRSAAALPSSTDSQWKNIQAKYLSEYEKFLESVPMSNITSFCESQRVFDRKMNAFFASSGLLQGTRKQTLRRFASQVPLRPGAHLLLSEMLAGSVNPKPGKARMEVHVVSCSWSKTFLRAALNVPSHLDDALRIHCNDLEWDAEGVCSEGKINFSVQDPLDKSELMAKICAEVVASSSGDKNGQKKKDVTAVSSVFVGDSPGDIHAMVQADVGLLMGANVSGRFLASVCEKCGIKIISGTSGRSLTDLAKESREAGGSVVFNIESWEEIRELMIREGLIEKERNKNPATVLCISGSDSGGGAGNQADLKTCAAYGMFGMSALTALTAQNTQGVSAIRTLEADFVQAQIKAVVTDIGVDAVKTGMLATKEIVSLVAKEVKEHRLPNVVVDPVLVATSGDTLAKEDIAQEFLRELFPVAEIVTPNIPEAEILLGWDAGTIKTEEESIQAAKELHKYGSKWVLVKGGHLSSTMCVDVLYDGQKVYRLQSKKLTTKNTHGTGCTLGSAIACGLAAGLDMPTAVKSAKAYLTTIIGDSTCLTLGNGSVQGPMHHQVFKSTVNPLLKRLDCFRMYAVTDSSINAKNNRNLVSAVLDAVKGGASIVQLREKHASTSELIGQAKSIIEVCRPLGIPVIINDRVDVAIAVDADGVHVGDEDMAVTAARKMIGPLKILGVSVKTPEQALQAQEEGADYVGAGACFSTNTKSDSTLIGLDAVKRIHSSVDIPVVAIGGINHSNAGQVLSETQVEGIAVVSAVFDKENITDACREMRKIVDRAK